MTDTAWMAQVAAQKARVPALYGEIDFSLVPERFTSSPADTSALGPRFRERRAHLLQNRDRVAVLQAHTLMGDAVADAYAALIPQHGFRRLTQMLEQACRQGLESVADAPAELVAFLQDMERTPGWLDMRLVEEGARAMRNFSAHFAPYMVRGAFIGTFMNKYSALPMAMTGTLSNETAARRIKETASFFTMSVLPGALSRHGDGFRSAAMVRLMHSMVRFHALRRPGQWDFATYGIPIPQVDQMPAGLMFVFRIALKALRQGRSSFNRQERALVELARYRCFLLGLPEALLADTPQAVVDLMLTREATLRDGFDDATCGSLVRASMSARLEPGEAWFQRLQERLALGFAKVFFVKIAADGDGRRAAAMGVALSAGDKVAAALVALSIGLRMAAYGLAAKVPGLRDAADRVLVHKLERLLRAYGHAEFATDATHYKPTHAG